MAADKILFLDCDGVCNRASTFKEGKSGYLLEPELMERVKQIMEQTGCRIVLSSAWRFSSEGREAVKKYLPLYDITPHNVRWARGVEIHQWLRWHPEVTRYAILDDDSDFLSGQPLFKTNFTDGLTEEIANKVIEYLNGD